MKIFAKVLDAYELLILTALICVCLQLMIIMGGEGKFSIVGLAALSAPFLFLALLQRLVQRFSSKRTFALFGAILGTIGTTLAAGSCIYILAIALLSPPSQDSRVEMRVYSILFLAVLFWTPLVIFLLAFLSSVRRFMQLNTHEVTPCPQ
jgi:hypothetical protein